MNHYDPEDRADPAEQPIRARVPDHVSGGAFSTGVIVMTAQAEFILDFVQNLGRPHQIVSRVVMPHNVLPQLVDALKRNMELYRTRWGELPQVPIPGAPAAGGAQAAATQPPGSGVDTGVPAQRANDATNTGVVGGGAEGASSSMGRSGPGPDSQGAQDSPPREPAMGSGARQATAQEVYDDLKIRDELLSGAYANAVMIGHGPHEFSFDFITNFYPHSAVSARVFLAAGQVPRLYDSLKGTWEQLRRRLQPPPGNPPQA